MIFDPNDPRHKDRYVRIPAIVAFDPRLNHVDRAVVAALAYCAFGKKRETWYSNAKIAAAARIKPDTLPAVFRRLEGHGLIERRKTDRYRSGRIIVLNWKPVIGETPLATEPPTPGSSATHPQSQSHPNQEEMSGKATDQATTPSLSLGNPQRELALVPINGGMDGLKTTMRWLSHNANHVDAEIADEAGLAMREFFAFKAHEQRKRAKGKDHRSIGANRGLRRIVELVITGYSLNQLLEWLDLAWDDAPPTEGGGRDRNNVGWAFLLRVDPLWDDGWYGASRKVGY